MTDLLTSWNDCDAKDSIQRFIVESAAPGSGFIEAADRIAVFDNDGTMWIEQPQPVQIDFIFRALTQAAAKDPAGVRGAGHGLPAPM